MRLLMFKADSGPMLGVLRPGSNDENVEVVELSEIPDLRALIVLALEDPAPRGP